MPPKKKGNKKAQEDDWEADLGETITPQTGGAEEPKAEEAAPGDDAGGGGLMAALQRRGKKKKNKGGDFELEGEDPPVDDAISADALESKAPQEGTFDDDDDDVFAGNYGKKKGKGKGGAAPEKQEEPKEEPQEDKTDDGPRVKTKAEKEKEKKEKEKQRKKELVCPRARLDDHDQLGANISSRLQRRKPPVPRKPSQRSPSKPKQSPLLHPQPLHPSPQLLAGKRRSLILPSPHSKSNKKSGRRRRRN